jgi:hypothetical protein
LALILAWQIVACVLSHGQATMRNALRAKWNTVLIEAFMTLLLVKENFFTFYYEYRFINT